MHERRTWVATFDGASCRVFDYDAADGRLKEIVNQRREGAHEPQFESAQDSVHARVGPRRCAVEPHTDPERLLEDRFVAGLAQHLARALGEDAFDELIVAEGPRALSAFRKVVAPSLAERIAREVHGNYVNGDQNRLLKAFVVEAGAR